MKFFIFYFHFYLFNFFLILVRPKIFPRFALASKHCHRKPSTAFSSSKIDTESNPNHNGQRTLTRAPPKIPIAVVEPRDGLWCNVCGGVNLYDGDVTFGCGLTLCLWWCKYQWAVVVLVQCWCIVARVEATMTVVVEGSRG